MFTTTEYLLADEANAKHLQESITQLAHLRATKIKETKDFKKRTRLKVDALKQKFHLLSKTQQEAFFKAEAFTNDEVSLEDLLKEAAKLHADYSRASAVKQQNYEKTHQYDKELADSVQLANAVWLCLSNVSYDWYLPIVLNDINQSS